MMIHRGLINKFIAGSTVLITAYLLKSFYSQANSEGLVWIIAPTAWLTEIFSHLSFIHEPGYGWVDAQHSVVIAPVCAGVNFLIISFCMSSCQILCKTTSPKNQITGVITAGLASYALTVVANAARIILSVALLKPDIYSGWLTPGMLHRVAGTVVYYLLLCMYSCSINYWFVNRGIDEPGGADSPTGRQFILLVPLFWYLLLSLGVPFANNAFRNNPEQFIAHALGVGVVTSLLTLVFFNAQYLYIRMSRVQDKKCREGN